MIIIIAKVFALVLALLVVARSITDFRNKRESLQMTIFWIIVWVAVVILAVFPSFINIVISALGGSRTGLGTIFGMAIVFVLFISYRIYVKANRIEKQLEIVSRQYALLSFELEKKKKR